ncbi:MAG: plasma-membrane proton-efflux P-type ATPase [candidate division Zixibacteria bacterium RBG_16_53_22]|nr:MAG: plasma-membrane proton-efflux P-type ATPase [candidate division Zixibacteria bacterium RBG_16_53_22]
MTENLSGLSAAEARARLQEYGPNAIREERKRPWVAFALKMWGPVPWMLEASILLELLLGKYLEAGIIALLLVFNALLSTIEENHSQDALALLRQRLTLYARVLRDGIWQTLPAREIVPGDIVHLQLGDLVPGDVRLTGGGVLLDQSVLTGESLPIDAQPGQIAYAGGTVKHGEATGEVTATGSRTYFGKTAELVRMAKTKGHLEGVIFAIVRSLVILDAVLVGAVVVYALWAKVPPNEILPFALILLVASVPVALPATFTLATALGAQELAQQGVLVTHLAAIEEAAGMDALCADKTGTITENRLSVSALHPYSPYTETDVLRYAAIACDDATQDPIDLAILKAAHDQGNLILLPARRDFIPFDPASKRSEAVVEQGNQLLHVTKGAPHAINALTSDDAATIDGDVEELASQGFRVLAIAVGDEHAYQMVGLISLQDPPRADSGALIDRLRNLGIRVIMITGDGLPTARAIAAQVGIGKRICVKETLDPGHGSQPLDCDVFAEVLPEHKFNLVKLLQQAGHTVGMTGDGVNDAPALKQAEVGIAVSNATDVAKAAASLVLTNPGLTNIIAAVESSRRIYQRMVTYTLNKIIKTIEIAFFLSLGLIITGTFVTTPLLIVLLMFTNDFVTMSIATDRVTYSPRPNRWQVRQLVAAALSMALPILLLSFTIFEYARTDLRLPLPQQQTLIFTMLVFSGQGMIYLVRERDHFWHSRPGKWLLLSTVLDVIVVSFMATAGILMTPIPVKLVAGMLGTISVYLIALDFLKVQVFKKLGLH